VDDFYGCRMATQGEAIPRPSTAIFERSGWAKTICFVFLRKIRDQLRPKWLGDFPDNETVYAVVFFRRSRAPISSMAHTNVFHVASEQSG